MNLDKYEKIDGWQALERFKNGETAFCYFSDELHEVARYGEDLYSAPASNGSKRKALRVFTINKILGRGWYIPKPFDVRQAMRDRPNEWVGVFKENGDYYKIGFDNENYQAVHTLVCNVVKPNYELRNVYPCEKEHFDKSIPIEDVPEEATR